MTIQVTPEVLRNTSSAIQSNIETAHQIINGYLGNQENVMGNSTWAGPGVNASYATAGQLHSDLTKMLTGAARLAEGLNQAASLMEAHEDDSTHAFNSLFSGGSVQSV
ncbi:MAG: WXG100 family type VII secretion target [Mycolicibacterium sp.]|uniref:WXG100 family type VII secretion target n=1 Tax=Mycolicibacterium sp. TaxID=2320850 RepID=UPI003D0B4ED6